MNSLRPVFLATSKEAKEIFMPFYRELLKLTDDIMIYNSGPVCEEIKNRNVVITASRELDKDIMNKFGCGVVCLTKQTSIDLGICSIKREAEKHEYKMED